MKYQLSFSQEAEIQIAKFKKSSPNIYAKIISLIKELIEHPETGTGKPERMKYSYRGYWSRRITQEHRMIYRIDNEKIIVFIISVESHYGAK